MDGLPGIPAPYDAENLHSPEVQLAAALMADASVLITGPDGTGAALLRVVAARLALSRTRVLRVGPPLDLPGFLDQAARAGGVASSVPGGVPDDTGLEQGFAALTDPGPFCDRIALLVENAHLMSDATLRYIEFAMHAGPHLCVAFAGQPGIADTLALPGYAGLRRRLSLQLVLLPVQPAAPVAAPWTASAETLPVNAAPVRRRGIKVRRELAGAALAAGVAVLLLSHTGPPPPTSGTADAVQGQPVGSVLAEPLPPSGVAQPAVNPTSTGSIAAGKVAKPALPAMQQAAIVPNAAEPEPAPPGTLASSPPLHQPDPPAALSASGEAAGPAPAVASIEPPAAVEASRVPDTAPDLQQPVLADAPAAVPPAAPDQEGPTLAGVAGLPPAASAIASMPSPAAPHVAGPPAAPGQDGPMPAAIAGLRPEPPAPVPPSPAPTLQAAPQADGPPAVLDPGSPAPAVAAGLLTPPAPAPSQPATGLLAAPQAGGRQAVPAPHDPSTVQAAGRTPAWRRPPPRAAGVRNEQAAARPATAGPDLGYCRGIVLRAQLGEDLTYGDRIFMRNGCR